MELEGLAAAAGEDAVVGEALPLCPPPLVRSSL
jgi:hypothetical protein